MSLTRNTTERAHTHVYVRNVDVTVKMRKLGGWSVPKILCPVPWKQNALLRLVERGHPRVQERPAAPRHWLWCALRAPGRAYLPFDRDQLHVQLSEHRGSSGGVGRDGLHVLLREKHSFRRFPFRSIFSLCAMFFFFDLRNCLSRRHLHDTHVINEMLKKLKRQVNSNKHISLTWLQTT